MASVGWPAGQSAGIVFNIRLSSSADGSVDWAAGRNQIVSRLDTKWILRFSILAV